MQKRFYFNQKTNTVVRLTYATVDGPSTVHLYQIIKFKSGNIFHRFTVEHFEFMQDALNLYNAHEGFHPSTEVQFQYVAIDYYSTTKTQGDLIRAKWEA